MLLVSGATETVRRLSPHPNLGRFVQPRSGNRMDDLANCGLPWAADNDCYQGLDPDEYMAMLDGLARVDLARLMFVTVPDVVGDHHVSLALFRYWLPALRKRDLPVAFVAQDGARPDLIPWDDLDAVFIGGRERWKKSQVAARIIRTAKLRRKIVHAGRCNADWLIVYFHALGVDSFDGGKYSRWPDTYIPNTLRQLAALDRAPQLTMKGVMLNAI
jgi:hypothetical protein